jgi:hypothetical protein
MSFRTYKSVRVVPLVLGLGALAGCFKTAAWRGDQEVLIAEAIVLDIVSTPIEDEDERPGPMAYCVFGRSDARGRDDPAPTLVSQLRAHGVKAYPVSQCTGWRVAPTGAAAHVVGILSLEWKDDSFVRAEAAESCGRLCGGTRFYLLSRDRAGWTVDTARPGAVF